MNPLLIIGLGVALLGALAQSKKSINQSDLTDSINDDKNAPNEHESDNQNVSVPGSGGGDGETGDRQIHQGPRLTVAGDLDASGPSDLD